MLLLLEKMQVQNTESKYDCFVTVFFCARELDMWITLGSSAESLQKAEASTLFATCFSVQMKHW